MKSSRLLSNGFARVFGKEMESATTLAPGYLRGSPRGTLCIFPVNGE